MKTQSGLLKSFLITLIISSVSSVKNNVSKSSEGLTSGITPDDIELNLRTFFSVPRNHKENAGNVRNWNLARALIHNIFRTLEKAEKINFTVDEFTTTEKDYQDTAVKGKNFYLTFRGQHYGTPTDKIIVVCAHYESKDKVPGTNNNGSGISVLLEIAKALGRLVGKFTYTVILVANDMQEYQSLGIKRFIDHYLIPEVLKNGEPGGPSFHGAIVLETIMNFDSNADSQKIPGGSEDTFKGMFPELHQFWTDNLKKGTFLLSLARKTRDEPLKGKIDEHWYGKKDISMPDAIELRMQSVGLDIPDLDGQIPNPADNNPADNNPGDDVPVYNLFLYGDYQYFYYVPEEPVGKKMKAIMLTDTMRYRSYMETCYAKECDDVSQITQPRLGFLVKTADSIFKTLLDMAEYTPATSSGSRAIAICGSMTMFISTVLAAAAKKAMLE